MRRTIAMAAIAAALTACQTTPDDPPRATAALQPTKGNKAFGEATFEQQGDKVRVIVFAQNLPPDRELGFHVHEAGDCSSGDGMSTGGHFNPLGKPHGNPAVPDHHAGDMPMLVADASGNATLVVELDVMTVGSGDADIVGRGLIVHKDPDDFTTQPTGNSGARVACGVITRS